MRGLCAACGGVIGLEHKWRWLPNQGRPLHDTRACRDAWLKRLFTRRGCQKTYQKSTSAPD
jgi:hypothetical protein